MRLWSIHPQYLDTKGIVALWRETLLAQKVLLGKTKGYKNHPQLERFKKHGSPLLAIGCYLATIHNEALKRGFKFKKKKILFQDGECASLKVTHGQLHHEFNHLKEKLKLRSPENHGKLIRVKKITVHPFFRVVQGERETWEKVKRVKK